MTTISGDLTAADGSGQVSFTLSDYDQEGGAELLHRLFAAIVREMSPPNERECWFVTNTHL